MYNKIDNLDNVIRLSKYIYKSTSIYKIDKSGENTVLVEKLGIWVIKNEIFNILYII